VSKVLFRLGQRDDEILRAVYTYRFLTLREVTRLFFALGSKNHAGEYLKRLAEHRYLDRFPLPAARPGNPEFVYMMGHMGIKYLRDVGADVDGYVRPAHDPTYLHLQHTLCLNDVLIALALLGRDDPAVSLVQMRHEWMLKQTPLSVQLTRPEGKETVAIVPDAWVDVIVTVGNKRRRMPVWIELDRGTIEQRQWRRKARGIVAAVVSNAYAKQFGTSSIAVAYITTAGERRTSQMRAWTIAELQQLRKMDESEMFLFTHLPDGDIDPKRLFLKPVWSTVAEGNRVPLFMMG
jgi:Replication-relaxation